MADSVIESPCPSVCLSVCLRHFETSTSGYFRILLVPECIPNIGLWWQHVKREKKGLCLYPHRLTNSVCPICRNNKFTIALPTCLKIHKSISREVLKEILSEAISLPRFTLLFIQTHFTRALFHLTHRIVSHCRGPAKKTTWGKGRPVVNRPSHA